MNYTTSLSAGMVIHRLLTSDVDVRASVTKVFPVVTDEATLPYVAYRRSGFSHNAAKGRGADTITVDVRCYAATYAESIALAEKVRSALDYVQTDGSDDNGLRLRSCTLTGADEFAEADAFVQQLSFTLKL